MLNSGLVTAMLVSVIWKWSAETVKAMIEEVGLDAVFILLAGLPQGGVSGDGRVGGKRSYRRKHSAGV